MLPERQKHHQRTAQRLKRNVGVRSHSSDTLCFGLDGRGAIRARPPAPFSAVSRKRDTVDELGATLQCGLGPLTACSLRGPFQTKWSGPVGDAGCHGLVTRGACHGGPLLNDQRRGERWRRDSDPPPPGGTTHNPRCTGSTFSLPGGHFLLQC